MDSFDQAIEAFAERVETLAETCKKADRLGYDIIHDARGYQVVQRFGDLVGEVVYTTDDPADALAFCQYEDSHP